MDCLAFQEGRISLYCQGLGQPTLDLRMCGTDPGLTPLLSARTVSAHMRMIFARPGVNSLLSEAFFTRVQTSSWRGKREQLSFVADALSGHWSVNQDESYGLNRR